MGKRRRDDDIVADILSILKAPLVEVYVRKLIDDLRANCPPLTGNKNLNIGYLRDLRNKIARFKKLLKDAPAPLKTVLFSPEFALPLLIIGQGYAGDFNPRLREYLAQRQPVRLAQLVEMLDWLDAQCKETVRLELGTHGALDNQKLHAAIASRSVLEEAVAFYPDKKPLFGCSETSDYCKVASLFYEAMTGKDFSDLRHACELALTARAKQEK
jgi:hypothetical protein